MNDQQKNYKTEINKMLGEVDNVRSKWYSPETFDKVGLQLQETEK